MKRNYKMDERVILANEISKLILKNTTDTDIKKIIGEVNRFDALLGDTIRNFYEIKQDNEAPLFELYEYLKLGAKNYYMDEEEFNNHIDYLVREVNIMFGCSLRISEHMKRK
jgi:hypothetical protein